MHIVVVVSLIRYLPYLALYCFGLSVWALSGLCALQRCEAGEAGAW